MNTQEQIEAWEAQREEAIDGLTSAITGYLKRRKELAPEGQYPESYGVVGVEDFSLDSYGGDYIEIGDDYIEVGWEGYRHCGCCAPDTYKISFPKSHLWDPDWEEKFLAEQAEAKRLKDEEERQKKAEKKAERIAKEKARLRELQAKYPNEIPA